MTTSHKVALVTGASSGIGTHIALQLADLGMRVVCAGRNEAALQSVVDQIGPLGHALVLDVADADSVSTLCSRLPDEFQDIDVLVNNAGHAIGGKRRLDEGDVEQWVSIIDTNLTGLVRVTHAIVPTMLARRAGHIVNVGSVSGREPVLGDSLYCASKYGVHGFTEVLRADYADTPIRITEILPGMVRTNFAATRFSDAEAGEQYYADHGVCLNPEDVAAAVVYAVQQPPNVVIAEVKIVPSGQT